MPIELCVRTSDVRAPLGLPTFAVGSHHPHATQLLSLFSTPGGSAATNSFPPLVKAAGDAVRELARWGGAGVYRHPLSLTPLLPCTPSLLTCFLNAAN